MKYLSIVVATSAAFMTVSCQKEIKSAESMQMAETAANKAALTENSPGAVFTMTNAESENKIVSYMRATDGTLTLLGHLRTGGKGTGTALGSQGSIVVSEDKNWLFAVNAGSHQISVVHITPGGPEITDMVSSYGRYPISIAVHKDLVYVLNAMEDFTGRIVGYRFNEGKLEVLGNSRKSLSKSDAVRPAQISFSSDGSSLILTQKANNKIAIFDLNPDGTPGDKQLVTSGGVEPFGFAIGKLGHIYVTEAFNGKPNRSAVSAYKINTTGNLITKDESEKNHQTASCWAVLTENCKYLYVTNTGSNTISGYRVTGGSISLLNHDGITTKTGVGPADEALSAGSKYLYVLNQLDKSISGYAVHADGSLSKIGNDITGLHQKSVGLAAW